MSRRFLTMAAVALTGLLHPLSADAQLSRLRPQLEQRIAQHKGKVGLALIDLANGERLSIRGEEQFPSASVIKLPILIELFHQIQKGPLRLTDPITLLAADQRPGSGILQFLSTPHQLTVGDAATLMIIVSDNTATNLILDKVGIRNVNSRLDSLGISRTRLHAKVFMGAATSVDTAGTRTWGLGVTTASDIAELLARLYRGQIVSDSASRQMVGILKDNFDDDRIARYLPAGASLANKTGSLDQSRHDCGIVFSRQKDYVLCVLTSENQDKSWRIDNDASVLIADLARMTHTFMAAGT
ncbi:MAG TPA: serine hydrolase [Longimicrobiales bacterium]